MTVVIPVSASRGRGEQQEQRLGRRDEDVGGMAGERTPFVGGRVTGPDGHRDLRR